MSAATITAIRSLIGAGLLAAALMTPGESQAQSTVQAYTTTSLNQRAGPSTRFPVITVVPTRMPVLVYGCLRDFSWCDGSFQGQRGWLSARYLQLWYQGTYLTAGTYARYTHLPIVAFNINSYWPKYYANTPFYAQLAVYASGSSVQINIGSFYRPLAQHGSWVEVRGRYVWAPRVPANWRPYTDGRWVYNERYGWTWVSNEPFGWATYHYGRWAYSASLGWIWVPGTRWAPAWVAWRGSNDHLAWAPLPPDPDDAFGIDINISFGNIPNYYWQAVPSENFLAPNLATVVIGDNNQVTNIVNQTQVIGGVSIVNNVVVNNVINIAYVEEKTQEEVVAQNVVLTSEAPAGGQVEGDTVALFQPPAEELAPIDAPTEVIPVEQVAAASETAGQVADQPATDELVPPPPPVDEPPPANDAPPVVGDEQPSTITEDSTEAEAPSATAEAPPANLPEPCAENSVMQDDGSCAPPPDAPPLAEEVTPTTLEAPVEELAPPPTEESLAPAATPLATDAPAATPPTDQLTACPEGSVVLADGSCGLAPALTPIEEVVPPPDAAPEGTQVEQPPAAIQEVPADLPALAPESQPLATDEAPAEPPIEEAVPPAPPSEAGQPPPCAEGLVVNEEGLCALPSAPAAVEEVVPPTDSVPEAIQAEQPPAEMQEAPAEQPPPAPEAEPSVTEEAPAAPMTEEAIPPAGAPEPGHLPPCAEGFVVNEEGVCVLPEPQ